MIIHGDCRSILRGIESDRFDSVITDPPYGLEFMDQDWDRCVPGSAFWAEFLRVARPGALLASFGGTRTCHRLACAIEDAGWQIIDQLCWLHTNGIPKSKALLKPAWEPIILARKAGPVWLGGEECRIPYASAADLQLAQKKNPGRTETIEGSKVYGNDRPQQLVDERGRWPANLLIDDRVEGFGERARFFFCSKYSDPDNAHPTVKPIDLMRWLVRLCSKPGGEILDPFIGSGSTGRAAIMEGRSIFGVELDPVFVEIAERRTTQNVQQGFGFGSAFVTS